MPTEGSQVVPPRASRRVTGTGIAIDTGYRSKSELGPVHVNSSGVFWYVLHLGGSYSILPYLRKALKFFPSPDGTLR